MSARLVGSFLAGVACALLSAAAILAWDARSLGLVLAALSVGIFIVAARETWEATSSDWMLWKLANPFGLFVMTTVLVVLIGVVDVLFVKPTSGWLRAPCAILTGMAAGAIAGEVVPWLGAHLPHTVARLLRWIWGRLAYAVREVGGLFGLGVGTLSTSPAAQRGAEVGQLLADLKSWTGGWSFSWSGARALRCTTMGGVGAIGSLLAQRISHGAPASNQWTDVYAPLVGWTLGCLAGWSVGVHFFHVEEPAPAKHLSHGAALAGLAVALCFTPFAIWSAYGARADLFVHDHGVAYGAPDVGALRDPVRDLAPVFHFASGEKWHPTTVTWYLANTEVQERPAKATIGSPSGERRRLPCGGNTPRCRRLGPDSCDGADGHCALDTTPGRTVVYALTRSVAHDEMPAAQPYAGVDSIVQYWEFYNFDSFEHLILKQWHQADWEQITVGLHKRAPVFVAYSSHCFGTWLPWRDVPVQEKTHPIVWVALGTHANYPRPLSPPLRGGRCPSFKPPANFGIAGLFAGLVEAGGSLEVPADVGGALVDETDDDGVARTTVVLPRDPDTSEIAFHGTWGLDNNIAFLVPWPAKNGAPSSPRDHPEWQRPGKAILCNEKWFAPAHAKPKPKSCDALSS